MLATSAVASAGPTPRMASSRLLVSFDVLSHDAAIKGQDLGFQCQQLSPKSRHAGPGYLGEPSVVGIGNNFEQLLDTIAPDGATIPNSANCARMELMIAVCWRMNKCRVR
jgi:hypothetical protein